MTSISSYSINFPNIENDLDKDKENVQNVIDNNKEVKIELKKKWEEREAQKPARERKPLPQPPAEYSEVEGSSPKTQSKM